jgi:hypothetical protein
MRVGFHPFWFDKGWVGIRSQGQVQSPILINTIAKLPILHGSQSAKFQTKVVNWQKEIISSKIRILRHPNVHRAPAVWRLFLQQDQNWHRILGTFVSNKRRKYRSERRHQLCQVLLPEDYHDTLGQRTPQICRVRKSRWLQMPHSLASLSPLHVLTHSQLSVRNQIMLSKLSIDDRKNGSSIWNYRPLFDDLVSPCGNSHLFPILKTWKWARTCVVSLSMASQSISFSFCCGLHLFCNKMLHWFRNLVFLFFYSTYSTSTSLGHMGHKNIFCYFLFFMSSNVFWQLSSPSECQSLVVSVIYDTCASTLSIYRKLIIIWNVCMSEGQIVGAN